MASDQFCTVCHLSYSVLGTSAASISGSVNAHPTGDQEVNIFSWRLIMNIFYGHSLPSPDSRKNVHNTG